MRFHPGNEDPSAPRHEPRALEDPRNRLQHHFEGKIPRPGTSSSLVKWWRNKKEVNPPKSRIEGSRQAFCHRRRLRRLRGRLRRRRRDHESVGDCRGPCPRQEGVKNPRQLLLGYGHRPDLPKIFHSRDLRVQQDPGDRLLTSLTRSAPTHPPTPSGYGSSTPPPLAVYATFTIHRGKGSMANLDNGNVERGNREDDGGAGRGHIREWMDNSKGKTSEQFKYSI